MQPPCARPAATDGADARSPSPRPSRRRGSIAHASPAGPAPTTTTWGSSVGDTGCGAVRDTGCGSLREQRRDVRAAVEALAAAHERARAPAQAVDVDGRDGR